MATGRKDGVLNEIQDGWSKCHWFTMNYVEKSKVDLP